MKAKTMISWKQGQERKQAVEEALSFTEPEPFRSKGTGLCNQLALRKPSPFTEQGVIIVIAAATTS